MMNFIKRLEEAFPTQDGRSCFVTIASLVVLALLAGFLTIIFVSFKLGLLVISVFGFIALFLLIYIFAAPWISKGKSY